MTADLLALADRWSADPRYLHSQIFRDCVAELRALAARLPVEWMRDGKEVAWVAKVERDWTTLEVRSGDIYAFSRETGRVYKLPDPAVPIVILKRAAAPATGGSE